MPNVLSDCADATPPVLPYITAARMPIVSVRGIFICRFSLMQRELGQTRSWLVPFQGDQVARRRKQKTGRLNQFCERSLGRALWLRGFFFCLPQLVLRWKVF